MFRIEKKILENNLTYNGTVILKYQIEYPQIISNFYDTEKFNSFNLNRALNLEKYAKESLFSDAKSLYDYNVSNNYPIMVYELLFTTVITYDQAPIVSLYQDEYTFTGGAHGSTIRTSQNWNLIYPAQFGLNDLYPSNPNYLLFILREINRQIKEKGAEFYFDDYCSLVLETFNIHQFYLTPHFITFYFQQYDIAPYSTGIPTFEIPY